VLATSDLPFLKKRKDNRNMMVIFIGNLFIQGNSRENAQRKNY